MKLTIQFVADEGIWDIEDHSVHARSKRRHLSFLFGEDVILQLDRRIKEVEANREQKQK
jgi:hypothetical protein